MHHNKALRVREVVISALVSFTAVPTLGFSIGLSLSLQGVDTTEIQHYLERGDGKHLLSISAFAISAGVLIFMFWWFGSRRHLTLVDFGIVIPDARHVARSAVVAVLIVLVLFSLGTLSDQQERSAISLRNALLLTTDGSLYLLSVVSVVVIAPFMEELLYRVALYKALAQHMKPVCATVVAVSCFTIVHYPYLFLAGNVSLIALSQVVLMGLSLTWLFHTSASIWPPFLVHALYNGIVSLSVAPT